MAVEGAPVEGTFNRKKALRTTGQRPKRPKPRPQRPIRAASAPIRGPSAPTAASSRPQAQRPQRRIRSSSRPPAQIRVPVPQPTPPAQGAPSAYKRTARAGSRPLIFCFGRPISCPWWCVREAVGSQARNINSIHSIANSNTKVSPIYTYRRNPAQKVINGGIAMGGIDQWGY